MRTDDKRYAAPPVEAMGHRRRKNEQLYDADAIAMRAVVGLCEQRFWTELEEAGERERVGGAIGGGLLGGILGHQVGGSTGRDIATVGAVVAGAALCANGGRDKNGQRVTTQDLQRCTDNSSSSRPDCWNATYNFRGQEHRVQISSQLGRTIAFNPEGVPRRS